MKRLQMNNNFGLFFTHMALVELQYSGLWTAFIILSYCICVHLYLVKVSVHIHCN